MQSMDDRLLELRDSGVIGAGDALLEANDKRRFGAADL